MHLLKLPIRIITSEPLSCRTISPFSAFGINSFSRYPSEFFSYSSFLIVLLTDRILEIAPKSAKANEMVKEMYTVYIESLNNKNNYLASDQIEVKIEEMKERLEKLS